MPVWGQSSRFACVLLITGLVGAALLRAAAAKEFLGIHLGPTPSEFPTRSFRDDTAAAIAGTLLLKYNVGEARAVAAQWFQAARDYLPSLAESNPLPPTDINVAIANSLFANMTRAAGNALASFLPDHLGKDSFEANYTQAFIPGLVTGLRGIRYEPCLLRSAVLGAGASANGLVFNPELFATRSTGAVLSATGLRIRPALLVIEPSAAPGVAIGGLVAPSLITVIPTHVQLKDVGLQVNPALMKINSSPNVPLIGPDKSFESSPPPSAGSATDSGSGSEAGASNDPEVTFTLPP